ncbi:MAG: antitoxin Xre/MbcA/ParS toxin-binding domain-containing protein [Pseudomonadota bacterium]
MSNISASKLAPRVGANSLRLNPGMSNSLGHQASNRFVEVRTAGSVRGADSRFIYKVSSKNVRTKLEDVEFRLAELERASLKPGSVFADQVFIAHSKNNTWGSGRRQKSTGIVEAFCKICQRWQLDLMSMIMLLHLENVPDLASRILSGEQSVLPGDVEDRMTYVVAISLGLGAVFDDDAAAELDWLTSPREELRGETALSYMLEGTFLNILHVNDFVEELRGLK